MSLRSETEKLVGQELIKALSDFKQLAVAPFSSNGDTRSFICHRRTKINYRKPVVKVVQDMLTKKWVFVRKNKKLSASPLVMVRREDEQLVGRALFKAQTNLKVSSVLLCLLPVAMSYPPRTKQWLYLQRVIRV
jgi:hypothetical protein